MTINYSIISNDVIRGTELKENIEGYLRKVISFNLVTNCKNL